MQFDPLVQVLVGVLAAASLIAVILLSIRQYRALSRDRGDRPDDPERGPGDAGPAAPDEDRDA